MTGKKKEPMASSEIVTTFPGAGVGISTNPDNFIDTIDSNRISGLEERIKDLKEKTSKKVYAVKMDLDLLESLISFIRNDAEWIQTESLGVIELDKILSKIKSEGIKDNTIFMEGTALEATHYFLSKTRGKGLNEAKSFISLFKPFSVSLEEVKKDAETIKSLETELKAAYQGIEVA
jgi:hypothetical protein